MLRRRHFLMGLGSSVALTVLPVSVIAHPAGATQLAIVLLASENVVNDGVVRRAGAEFTALGIPVGLALQPGAGAADFTEAAALLDVAIRLTEPIPTAPYFQTRQLSEARTRLDPALPSGARCSSVCAPDPGGELDLRGLRAAGVRTAMLIPEESAPTTIEVHARQIVATRGGHVARVGAVDAARGYIDEAVESAEVSHATLFVDLDGEAEAVVGLARDVAAAVHGHVDEGRLSPVSLYELGVRHVGQFERLVGLLLVPPAATWGDAEARAQVTEFSDRLREAGIEHSIAVPGPEDIGVPTCTIVDNATAMPQGLSCALVTDPDLAKPLAETGAFAALNAAPEGFFGIDGNGLYHFPPALRAASWEDLEAIDAGLQFDTEEVIELDLAALTTPAQRNGALADLRTIATRPGTRFVDLTAFANGVVTPDRVFETMRETRIAAPRIAPRPDGPLTPAAREAFMADAARAWSYFEATRRRNTGVPGATVQFTAAGEPAVSHDKLTQWDMGSVIFGQIAALKLGLIRKAEFDDWRLLAIDTLRSATRADPRLPRAVFDTKAPWTGSADFNACDSARLLSALAALDRLAPEDDTTVRDLVASWDLEAPIIDGVPHSLMRGQLIATLNGHCSQYLARAYAQWGIEAKSEYEVYRRGATETDRQMQLLYKVGEIGAFGAEPLLLDMIELGPCPENAYLADVLFAAQLDAYEATGKLYAPSESPREAVPWFTYQGLRVDYTGEPRWDVTVIGEGPDYATPEFRARTRMVATKAAYLWAAARPHEYSDRLLAYVRDHAELPVGFASGVYMATDKPTPGYTDVNTNGVILQTIAHILHR